MFSILTLINLKFRTICVIHSNGGNIIIAGLSYRDYLPCSFDSAHLGAVINYYYTALLHMDAMSVVSLPVVWPSREKKRVKCEGPPSLGVVYQNIGAWRRRVIAHLTLSNPWHVTRVLHSLYRYMLVARMRTCS